MKKLLELDDIYVRGPKEFRLKGIQLSIKFGEKVALLGQSGAGKSTLISVANGALQPTAGKVSWRGIQIKNLRPRQLQEIGTLWQDLRLVEELTVCQNINIGALGMHNLFWAFWNLLCSINIIECLNCLEVAGLEHKYLTTPVHQLSGGQRQRVAIARLLRQQAELLLADEPLSNLDPNLVDEVLQLLLNKKLINSIPIPTTCLISLHRPDFITNFTRVIGLKEGEIVLDLPTNGLIPSDFDSLYKER